MKYVGARYMPKFMGLYDATTDYEALSVVDNGMGTTYVSNKPAPAGTPLTDTEYWTVYGASSGAILDLQNRMTTAETDIINIDDRIDALYNAINVKTPDSSTGLTGVVGDGVADDTTALNAIMQYALSNNMSVFFPAGSYKISTITIKFTSTNKTLNLYGVGNESVILSNGNGIIFQNESEASVPNYCKVKNLKFYGVTTSGTRLLQFFNVFNGLIEDCLFEHADIALVLGSCIWCNVINCRINGCSWSNVYMIGINEDARCLYSGNNAVNFYGCVSYGSSRDGFECIGNSGCNFYGCTSENNSRCGIYISKSGAFNGRGNLISGGWFEFNPSGCIYIDSTNSATDCSETIENCGFIWDQDATATPIKIVSNNGGILVTGCHFKRLTGTIAAMIESPNLRSVHNKFSYTPTYAEISGEFVDIPHCSVAANGSSNYNTGDITSITKSATGTYDVFFDHWVRSVSVTANATGNTASAAISNQADGTSYVTVVCRNLSTMADVDSAFTLIAM